MSPYLGSVICAAVSDDYYVHLAGIGTIMSLSRRCGVTWPDYARKS